MPTLEILSGKHAGESFPFNGETKIGKDETCPIRLTDPGVSRYHAVLSVQGGSVQITDLGSSNGTYVNFKKRGKDEVATLADNDIIFFGRTVTKFWAGTPPPKPAGVSLELLRSTVPVAGLPNQAQIEALAREAEQVEVIRRLRLHEVDDATLDRLVSQAKR
ncbi:MAG: FHA domain-containing protein [Planctomycetota bacterium]